MFSYGWEKFSEDSETSPAPIMLYNRKTSDSWMDEDEERDSWHEEFSDFFFLK